MSIFMRVIFRESLQGKLSIWVPYAEEQRVVEVEHDFWMGQYLITQEVYTQVMGANPSFTDVESDLFQSKLSS